MHHCSPFSGFAVQKQEFADPRFGICLFLHGNDILYPVSGHYGKSAAGFLCISWLAAWLFYLSVQILRIERIGYRFSWFAGSAAVLVAVVAFADHAFGPSYFFSALFALVAGVNMYLSVFGMQSVQPYRSTDGLMAGCIVLQVLLYLVSDFIQDYTCFNLYFAVDITLTLSMVALLPFTLREVGK